MKLSKTNNWTTHNSLTFGFKSSQDAHQVMDISQHKNGFNSTSLTDSSLKFTVEVDENQIQHTLWAWHRVISQELFSRFDKKKFAISQHKMILTWSSHYRVNSFLRKAGHLIYSKIMIKLKVKPVFIVISYNAYMFLLSFSFFSACSCHFQYFITRTTTINRRTSGYCIARTTKVSKAGTRSPHLGLVSIVGQWQMTCILLSSTTSRWQEKTFDRRKWHHEEKLMFRGLQKTKRYLVGVINVPVVVSTLIFRSSTKSSFPRRHTSSKYNHYQNTTIISAAYCSEYCWICTWPVETPDHHSFFFFYLCSDSELCNFSFKDHSISWLANTGTKQTPNFVKACCWLSHNTFIPFQNSAAGKHRYVTNKELFQNLLKDL